MEPPAEGQQETPALTETAAEFLSLIGGYPQPPGSPFTAPAVPWRFLGAGVGGIGSSRREMGRGGLSRTDDEGLGPACAGQGWVGRTEAGRCPGQG